MPSVLDSPPTEGNYFGSCSTPGWQGTVPESSVGGSTTDSKLSMTGVGRAAGSILCSRNPARTASDHL
jgi:hypothetical protein